MSQPDLSSLYHGPLVGLSIERLSRMLKALGQDVEIVVRPKPRTRRAATLKTLIRGSALDP